MMCIVQLRVHRHFEKLLTKKFKVEVVVMKRLIVGKFLNLRMTSKLYG
jgi:hypothetical protein